MWDLVGNPEDRFSQNEAHFGFEDRVLVVRVSGRCLLYISTSTLTCCFADAQTFGHMDNQKKV